MHRFFITGTDTGVGKSFFTCALAAALQKEGRRVVVMKPIETGCVASAGGALIAADAEALRYFATSSDAPELICPSRFAEPLAPQVAAARAGTSVDLASIRNAFSRLARGAETILVEGAGGLLVPIAPGYAMADLARDLELELLLVVGSKLGAINHARLTWEVARSRGLAVAGYAVNFPAPGADVAADTNVGILSELLGPPLGILPWHPGGMLQTPENRERLARLACERLDLDSLLRRTPTARDSR